MSKLCWLPEHAEQLKRLRLAAGFEITTLAKKHSISSAQVRQLEESGDSAFYSPEIKYTVGRKLIRSLGEEITELDFDGQFGSTALEEAPPLISANVQQPSFHPSSHQIFSRPKRRWVPWLLIPLTIGMAGYGLLGISSPEQTPAVEPKAQETKAQTPKTQQVEPRISQTAATIAAQPNDPPKASTSECDWSSESIDLTPVAGSRPGHYIYVVATQSAVVCWKDSAQAQRKITMKPSENITLEGRPPFHLHSTDLSGIKIYYRGNLIRTPTAGVQYVLLGKN
jgi:hypothetical protein